MLDLAAELGVGVTYQPYIFGTNFPDLPVNPDKDGVREEMVALHSVVAETVEQLIHKAHRLNVHTNLEFIRTYIEHYYRCAGTGAYFASAVLRRFVCSIPWEQLTIDDTGVILPCVFLKGKVRAESGQIYERWLEGALRFREKILDGAIYPACHSCTCYFWSNHRNSVLSFPIANRSGLSVTVRKLAAGRMRRLLGG